ncbi:MAG: cytochrome-c peroxidase, partial [Pseudobdellovibrionaceae bacterium]
MKVVISAIFTGIIFLTVYCSHGANEQADKTIIATPVPTSLSVLDEPLQPLPDSPHLDLKQVALGKKLFNEKKLSRNNTISCASCHSFAKGGADGL